MPKAIKMFYAKLPDDNSLDVPVIRISAGGNKDVGIYCKYRGDIETVREYLAIILKALPPEELPITPDLES